MPCLIGRAFASFGDDVVEGLERVTVLELGIGKRLALHDEGGEVDCRIMFMR